MCVLARYCTTTDTVDPSALSRQLMASPKLLDVPDLGEWTAQWDQLVDVAPVPSPFLRSWWLHGTSQFDRHFLLVVDGDRLLGGLALEERNPLAHIRMMGSGSASDHLDLLAAHGHETAVVTALGEWFRRPGGRLFELKAIRTGSRLLETLPGRVRVEPMVGAPFALLPDSAVAYRSTLSSQFRRNLRRASDRLCAESMTHRVIRGNAVLSSFETLRQLHTAQWGERSKFLPAFERFVTGCSGGIAADEVVVHELGRDNLVIAIVTTLEVAGRVSLYQSARHTDPRWRDATTVLLSAIIDDACTRGLNEVDFLRGEEPYKTRFATEQREMWTLIAGSGFNGRLRCNAMAARSRAEQMAIRAVRFRRSTLSRRRS